MLHVLYMIVLSSVNRPLTCTSLMAKSEPERTLNNNNNDNDFLCANILEDQAQWRDETKGLSNCVNVEQCVSR